MNQRLAKLNSVLTSAMAAAWTAFSKSWRTLIADEGQTYRPEAYYMRGPGPKWREKHAPGRGSVLR